MNAGERRAESCRSAASRPSRSGVGLAGTARAAYHGVVTALVCVLIAAARARARHRGRPPVGPQSGRSSRPTVPAAAGAAVGATSWSACLRSTDERARGARPGGDVVLHNARAVRARRGRRRPGRRPGGRGLRSRCCGAGHDGRRRPLAARPARPPPAAGARQVRPLGDGFTMVEAADTSEAVRLEATRRDFVANVSHELKTPVGAVGLLAEAVLDAADDPAEVRRFGTKILNESTRLGTLVTELIALSRLTGRGAAAGAGRGRGRRGRARGAAPQPARRRGRAASRSSSTRPSGLRGRRRPDAAGHRAVQPARERDRLLARRGSPVSVVAPAGRRRASRSRSPTAASASPRSTSSGSSSGSSGSTRPAPGPPAAPGSGWPSSSTCWPTTAARCGCGAARAPARRSRCGCPHASPTRSAPIAPLAGRRPTTVDGGRAVTRVLIVEDEESFADPLAFLLRKEGFTTAVAAHRAGRARRSSTATAPTSCCST